jgi:hypothetical protein
MHEKYHKEGMSGDCAKAHILHSKLSVLSISKMWPLLESHALEPLLFSPPSLFQTETSSINTAQRFFRALSSLFVFSLTILRIQKASPRN